MANNTATILKVSGPRKDLNKFIKQANVGGGFSFSNLFKIPEELLGTTSPTRYVNKELIKKYGCDNWYDWACDNWGTKWDVYDSSKLEIKGKIATCHYNTAWSPATNFYLKVSQDYPTLTFRHEFADEGGGFVGYQVIKNGEKIEETLFKWKSKEGIKLRKKLGYYYWEEYD